MINLPLDHLINGNAPIEKYQDSCAIFRKHNILYILIQIKIRDGMVCISYEGSLHVLLIYTIAFLCFFCRKPCRVESHNCSLNQIVIISLCSTDLCVFLCKFNVTFCSFISQDVTCIVNWRPAWQIAITTKYSEAKIARG